MDELWIELAALGAYIFVIGMDHVGTIP